MRRTGTPHPLLHHVSSALAFGFLLLIAPAVSAASLLPAPEDCAAMNPDNSGARMKCMFGNVIAQQEVTADMIGQLPNTSAEQMDRIRNAMARNERGMDRTPDMDFRELTKKKQAECLISEIAGDGIGDDDGICTGNEECLEAVGDQIGDDIQPCRTQGNPSQREVCVEVCDSDAINANPDNFDDGPGDTRGGDMEEMLTDLTEQNVELNEMLLMDMQLRARARALAQGGDDCAAAILARRDTNLLAFLVGVPLGAKLVADVCNPFGNLDISGFNVAPICAIPEGIAGVARILTDAFLFEDAVIDSDTIDATLGCVQSLSDSAEETQQQLENVQNQLTTVQGQLDTVVQQLDTTNRLLNTPTGRRDSFPKKNTR